MAVIDGVHVASSFIQFKVKEAGATMIARLIPFGA